MTSLSLIPPVLSPPHVDVNRLARDLAMLQVACRHVCEQADDIARAAGRMRDSLGVPGEDDGLEALDE